MKNEKVFWGILLVLGGVFLVVSKLGFLGDISVVSLLLTVLLAIVIVKSLFHLNFAGILFPLALIAIIYDKQLGITEATPWTVLLAALFGTIGLSLIFKKRPDWCFNHHQFKGSEYETIDLEDENHVKLRTTFGGSVKYINSSNFKQADIECSFGGMEVYFDNAVIQEDSAIIRLDVSFGGVDIYVPKTWRIENRATASFGSVDIKNSNISQGAPVLTLVGSVSFGGVDIHYV